MKRFTIRQYSDFSLFPQSEAFILFESDDLEEVIHFIEDYFIFEKYFNAVYFIDNKLHKEEYVGRNLTIYTGENLFELTKEEPK